MASARVDTSLWSNPRWTAMSSSAQLVALTSKALGVTGTVSAVRLMELTGWDEGFISRFSAEVAAAGFSSFLRHKRRPLPARLRRLIIDRDGPACRECGSTVHPHIDHIHPVSKGGTDDPENLQVLCRSCNLRKGARVGLVQGR